MPRFLEAGPSQCLHASGPSSASGLALVPPCPPFRSHTQTQKASVEQQHEGGGKKTKVTRVLDWSDKMAQQIKELAVKPYNLTLIPRTHVVEKETRLPQVVL